ncbi:MAG TPA: sigma-70 family RNA polymerase sigma factor [Moorella mulderi]|nr:sigma-70 family RNA polymerase sigma factor [Moorella mulderi]
MFPLKIKGRKNGCLSFEELVAAYQDKVFGLSWQLTGNQADAEDLAQEVFLRAYLALDNFRGEADPGTWLHRITMNVFLNKRRRESKAELLSLDAPVDTGEGEMQREVAAAGSDPLEALEELELKSWVKKILGELPPEFRAVLVLRELQGYSYEEMARILGCPPGTVKSRLNRARKAFKEKFLEEGGEW